MSLVDSLKLNPSFKTYIKNTVLMTEQRPFPYYQLSKTESLLLIFGIGALLLVYLFKIDFILADFIYAQFEWRFKKSIIVEGLLHKSARIVLIAVYLGMVYSLIKKIKQADDPCGIYNLFILLLAIGLSVSIVTIAKQFIDVDCPWDLIRYGGDKPYFSVLAYNSNYLPSANCFPASHASVGYSWIALYFYFKITQNKLKFQALGMVLLMGLIFGLAQQLRGAHFISHDLWSFLICLSTSILVYKIAYRKKSNTAA
jgi:membrane-associated PAP2 superfamily phosphatase